MPHMVFNLDDQPAAVRTQFRQLVAGIEPGSGVRIGRSRRVKPLILIEDAWIQVNDFDVATEDFHQILLSLALSNEIPPQESLLLPVGRVSGSSSQATNEGGPLVEQLFRAQGTTWAVRNIGIDIQEAGAVVLSDVDVHMDWSVTFTDWFSWFRGWNKLELAPDGFLVDGDREF